MGNLYEVRAGHTFHVNSGNYYSEGESFVAEEDEIKGQEYKLELKSLDKVSSVKNRAINSAENR